MDRSRQGLTRNESLRSETPTSYLILKHTQPEIYFPRLVTPAGGLERAPGRGGPELAGPRAGLLRVRSARGVRGNVSRGAGFLRSHLGFGDEVGQIRRQLVMF